MSAPKPREYEVETPVELSTPAQIALKLSLMKPLGKYNYSLVTRIDGEMLEPPRTIVYPESVLEEVNPVVLADLSRRHQERLEEGGLEPSTPSRFRNESIGRTITVTTKKRGFLGNALNKLKQIAGVEDSQARTTTTTGTVEPREYVE